jgi:1-acyl-sn-glycerol-3-phosphate acyltransferase/MFS family permease
LIAVEPKPSNQFALLFQRRFGPYFLAQFLTAANENLLKFSLTVMVSTGLLLQGVTTAQVGPWIGMAFLVPFVLCSAVIGPWIDAQDKGRLMRWLKGVEVLLMALAAWGMWQQRLWPLVASVALLGVYAACYGPTKFAYLPEHLRTRELMGGNGITMASTYLAMLLGYVLGAALVLKGAASPLWVGGTCLAVAALGWLASLGIPATLPRVTARQPWRAPWVELASTLAEARSDRSLLQAVVGLGWMWFVGAFYLSQIPVLGREVLGAAPSVDLLLLVIFGYGLFLASVFAEIISRQNVEVGVALVGVLGMGSFGGDLYFSTHAWPANEHGPPLSVAAFWAMDGSWRIIYDLLRLALGLGLFAAPLFAFIQWRARPGRVARIMAMGNLFNAAFLLAGFGVSAGLHQWGLSLPHLFVVGALFNAVAVILFFVAMPESVVRLAVLAMTRFTYRVRSRGIAAWPNSQGAALMVCNHVTYIDMMLVAVLSPRQLVVLCDGEAIRSKAFGWIFRRMPAMAMVSKDVDPMAYQAAVERARRELSDGGLVCVFPEGRITPDGQLQPFMDVVPDIVRGLDVPVFASALHNMWGSYYSRIGGAPMTRPFRRGMYNKVGLVVGQPMSSRDVTTPGLQAEVARLLQEPQP